MQIEWFLKETEYKKYRNNQIKYTKANEEGDYIGSVRVGELCFDIMDWGNHLWFDLYVGNVNSGYGYSNRYGYKDYPYDYADTCSFKFDKNLKEIGFEDFKKELSEYIEVHITSTKEYVSYLRGLKIDLIKKANEKLNLW